MDSKLYFKLIDSDGCGDSWVRLSDQGVSRLLVAGLGETQQGQLLLSCDGEESDGTWI